MHIDHTPTVLTIAGSDPYGGAGIQIDSKTIYACGGYALTVTTALTAQNSQGVQYVYPIPKETVKAQLNALLQDIKVDAVKIGMLANQEIITVVSEAIEHYRLQNIVLDTVLVSTSGHRLLNENSVTALQEQLFSLVDLITPNIPEVEALCHFPFDFESEKINQAAAYFHTLGVSAVLFKGGHDRDKTQATDYLWDSQTGVEAFSSLRVKTTHTHGTGCLYSSAIATHLALGYSLSRSIALAKTFLFRALQEADGLRLNYTENPRGFRKEPIF